MWLRDLVLRKAQKRVLVRLAGVGMALLVASCMSGDEVSLDGILSTHDALITGDLQAINGHYVSCKGRETPNNVWSAPSNGYAGALAHPLVSVVANDAACQLAIDEVVFDGTVYPLGNTLVLGTSYAENPVAVLDTPNGEIQMYINGNLSPADFSTAFVMQLSYAKDVNVVTPTLPSTYIQVTSNTVFTSVTPPNYLVSSSGVTIQLDSGGNVTSTGGTYNFSLLGQTGQQYAVVNTILGDPNTYSAVNNTYQSASKVSFGGGSFSVSINTFNLTGNNLNGIGVQKYLIVANTNTSTNTRAYQVFLFTFKKQ